MKRVDDQPSFSVLQDHCVLGLDVGGTAIKAGLFENGVCLTRESFSTQANDGPLTAQNAIVEAAKTMLSRATVPVEAIGLAVPGIVDSQRGVVVFSENLRWENVPIADIVSEATGLPVLCGHDVRTAALGEQQLGAGKGYDDFVFLPIGTGLAAALVLSGQIYEGAGLAGEIGHGGTQDGAPCVCGLRGCIETDATAGGIVAAYNRVVGDKAKTVTGAREVEELARKGDPLAVAVWDNALNRLGGVLQTLTEVLDPPLIVLGGGLSNAGEVLVDELTRRMDAGLSFHHRPRLVLSQLGSDAGMWGAGLLAARGLTVDNDTVAPSA